MTENKIKEATLEDAIYCAKGFVGLEVCEECRFYGLCHTWCDDVYRIIVDALEEIQAYRAIDTVEDIREIYSLCKILQNVVKDYSAIGTIEELQALKEKEDRFDRNIKMFNSIGLEIRAKAIDEFAEKVKPIIDEKIKGWTNSDDLRRWCARAVDDVAGQMKAGGIDG